MAGGVGGAEDNGAITRGRVTRARLDVAEIFALQDSGVTEVRRHGAVSQVAASSKGASSFYAQNVRLYASGAWGLQPLQLRLDQIQERTAGAGSVFLPASAGGSGGLLLQVAPVTTKAKFRRPTGTGMATVSSGTNANGSDIFIQSKISAGASWDNSAAVATETRITDLTSTLASLGAQTQPLDILARSNAAQSADQGFCIRFSLPGTRQHFPDWIAAFAFGQYAILIGGDGELRLWHYAPYLSTPGGAPAWRSVKSARYCSPSQVSGNSHCICIFPHMGEHGEKHISILSLNMDASSVSAAGGASTLSPAQGNTGAHTTTEALFTFDGTLTSQVDQGATGRVTTSTRIYLLERRDIRGEWQISRLTYPSGSPAGKLIGGAHAPTTPLTLGGVAAAAWSVTKFSRESGAMTITPRIKDARTDDATLIDYPYLLFDFYSNGSATPLLYGYALEKAQNVMTSAPGEFVCPVKNIQVQLGGQDVRNEVARFAIEDPVDAWPRLRNRGRLSLRLTTTYTPPGDTEKTITLFRGAVTRPTRTKKGTVGAVQGMSGAPSEYPSPEWSEYQLSAAGMWERLSATTLRTALSYELFLHDTAAAPAADGALVGWKVTDVIKRLLSAAGFPTSMMRIPDLPIRLNDGIGTSVSDSVLEPGTSIAQQVQNLTRNYLGRFLAFDPNDGTQGKWTLLSAPPAGTITPVFNFRGDIDPASIVSGTVALPHALHAFPANTAPTFGREVSYVVPPEKNHLWAFTAVNAGQAGPTLIDNHLRNFLSYKVPGSSIDPDPDSPHFLGHEALYVLGDPSFWAGGRPLSWQQTQAMVDYVLLRLFVGVCMPRRIQPIHAPLVFVQDAIHGGFRPLRFYDPVTLDGETGWYVRSINIDYTSDRAQLATYELERLVAYRPGI